MKDRTRGRRTRPWTVGYAARCVCFTTLLAFALLFGVDASATFSLGDAYNFGFIAGPNTTSIQISNSVFNGNVATDNPNTTAGGNYVQFSSGTINGDFSFVGTAQTNLGSGTLNGNKIANDSTVSSAYNTILSLSNNFAGQSGTSFGGSGAITATSGTNHGGNYFFTTTASNFLQGGALTITGGVNDYVIINVTGNNNVQLKNQLTLTGGITDDQVFINILGSNQQVGGNTNGGDVHGVFVAINDKFNVNNTTIDGRVIGGDSSDFQLVSGLHLNAPEPPFNPVPEPLSMLMLGCVGAGMLGARRLRRKQA